MQSLSGAVFVDAALCWEWYCHNAELLPLLKPPLQTETPSLTFTVPLWRVIEPLLTYLWLCLTHLLS